MKHRNIIKEKFAVAGVIEALLLIGLVAVILSLIQLNYVPQIMEEKESEHMDVVSNQFSQLKSVIDSQSLMGVLASDEPLAHAPMSSPITLGSKELPYFVSARSSGQINIIDRYKATDSYIDIDPAPGNFPSGIPLTSIVYRAYNYYYLSGGDLRYILEGGSIMLQQSSSGTVLVRRAMSIEVISDSTIKINYDIPLFKSMPGKNSTGGYLDGHIRTNYSSHETYSDTSITSIHIYTDYLEAWNQSLINDDNGVLWDYYNDYIDVDFDDPIDPTRIEITPLPGKNIDIDFTIVEIGVQTGPGIVYIN